jgi:hypothetical protein
MAKKETGPVTPGQEVEVVEDLHATTADDTVEYVDVTGQDDLPEGVQDTEEEAPTGNDTAPAADDELPAELKGKSPAEIARMYREAHALIGRQGSELGELRRTADTYIKAHLTSAAKAKAPKAEPEEKAPDDVDFFTNPQDAITKAVENHPAIKALKGQTREFAVREIVRQRQTATQEFEKAHPDAGEILSDAEFREWVGKSQVRQALLVRAHRNYDLTAANEIFNTWKELKAARTPKAPAKDSKPVADKKSARVPTSGNASPRSSAGGKGEKIYRRADIVRLMEQDPDRYSMMADEITKAYQEGRVR